MATNEVRDMRNSKFVLNVGDNYLESSCSQAGWFFDAKDNGAYIVTVDPHYSVTASKSHEWVPIEPGTDAALYLGMITVILDKKLYDESYMKKLTSFVFLVDKETGNLLRQTHEVAEGEEAPAAVAGDFMMWDTKTEMAVHHKTEGADPALEGEFEIDGKKYVTVFTKLLETQKPYTTAWAAKKTGIPAEKIEELAVRYATSGASALTTGYGGNDKMSNADVAGRAVAILAAMTHGVGRPGAFVGCIASGGRGYVPSMASWKFPSDMAATSPKVVPYDMPYVENNTHAYISIGDPLFTKTANQNAMLDFIKTMDFICCIDMYHMPAADWADLVMPACTRFESEYEFCDIRANNGHVQLREKVLDPLFEAHSDYRIQEEIAELFGVRDKLPENAEEWVKYRIANTTDKTLEGLTLEKLRTNQGLFASSVASEYRIHYADKFGTESGRFEVYDLKQVQYDMALPKWEDNNEVYAENPNRSKYPLQFSQGKSRYYIHDQFYDATWIQQFNRFAVSMNPADMEARGIKDGDKVRFFNDRGELVCCVKANNSIRPGSTKCPPCVWTKYTDKGTPQHLTNNFKNPRGGAMKLGPCVPFNDTLVQAEKA